MDNEIVAIIVTYNRKNMLLKCIDCIKNQKKAECDILIVDNASTDGTELALMNLLKEKSIKYVNTKKNIGGAGGFQYGILKAYEEGYKYFWLMDDDTFVNENTLNELLEKDKVLKGNYGYLSSVALWKDGSLCKMNKQHIDLRHRVDDIKDALIKIKMATFVSFFLKREVVEDVGLPIKEFFIWADDLEYSRRISLKYPCYVVSNSTVTHYMEKNDRVGIDIDSVDRLWRYDYLYRNELYVYRREGIIGLLFLVARVLLHSLRVLRSPSKEKMIRLKVIWKSLNKGMKFYPKIERVKRAS